MTVHWPNNAEPPMLALGEVHVWAVPLDDDRVSSAAQWSILAGDERERAERFRLDDARRRFVAARAGLRRLLSQYTRQPPADIAFDYDERGKPRLKNSSTLADLQFNLAHSGELALVAVTRGCEVGVDVERLRDVRHWPEIAERFFHSHEFAEINTLPPQLRIAAFMRCWTGKEAILKAIGTGVTQPLDFFVGPSAQGCGTWIDVPTASSTPTRCWLKPLVPSDDYVGAVACLEAERRVHCFALV